MNKIELHLAFVFDCDNCGNENFVRSAVLELDDEAARVLRDEHGVQPWEQGLWHSQPKQVKCKFCGEVYESE